MGLSIVCNRGWVIALLLLAVACCVPLACVQRIEFAEEVEVNYLFVDGAIETTSLLQQFKIGRTQGAGSVGIDEVGDAVVRLFDLTEGTETTFSEAEIGTYQAALRGRYNHRYRLEIELPGGDSYVAEVEPLQEVDLNLKGDTRLALRRAINGSLAEIASAEAAITLVVPEVDPGLVLARRGFGWTYTDRSCNGLDPSRICYFVTEPAGNFAIVDVASRTPGATVEFVLGGIAVDYRMAQASAIPVEITRVPTAAQTYYRDLSVALVLSGSIFSERPYTTLGNVVASEGAPAMLGYVAVRERQNLYLGIGGDIKARAGSQPCFGPNNLGGLDCCECLRETGAGTSAPAWWPF